jgi:hypothetical protein
MIFDSRKNHFSLYLLFPDSWEIQGLVQICFGKTNDGQGLLQSTWHSQRTATEDMWSQTATA